MADELDLSVPEREKKPSARPGAVRTLLVILLILGIANLVVSLSVPPRGERPPASIHLSPESQKNLALKLERQKLHATAVEAWQEYLASAQLDAEERAKIWYRVGKLHQEAGSYERALESFYRSESLAEVEELTPEINRRSQECLEALGKFAALRYHLAERVDLGKRETAPGEEVVAEIGEQKITKARLDQMIEGLIDRQLTQFAAYLPPEERNKQKEALLKHLSSPAQRVKMLKEFIAEELLYRRAREAKLADKRSVRALLRDAEKKILAGTALEQELADQIKILPGDLANYYQAHKKKYVEPEKAQISHILVKDHKATAAVRKRLQAGEAFEAVAKAVSEDKTTKENGGEISGWIEHGSYIPGMGYSDDATAVIFTTEAGKVAQKAVKTDKGLHIIKVRERKPERQKPFDEVRHEVFQALRAQKEADVKKRLFEELTERYDVVIHHSKFVGKKPEEKKPKGAKGQWKKDEKAKK